MEDMERALESRMSLFQVAWEIPVVSVSCVQFGKTELTNAASGAGRMDQLKHMRAHMHVCTHMHTHIHTRVHAPKGP